MTDNSGFAIAVAILLGLFLHGCMTGLSFDNSFEHEIVDERVLAEGMAEAACILTKGTYMMGNCYE